MPVPRILTVSSANMDLMARLDKMPQAGETLFGSNYEYVPGGKGGNAATAVARLGGESIFCTRLGNDTNGTRLMQLYRQNGIDTRFIVIDSEESTGLAAVFVETSEGGANRIAVFQGANKNLCADDVEEAFTSYPDALFLQFEIPTETVISAVQFAHSQNIPIIVDAGPASADYPLENLEYVDIFSPNESETFAYTGIHPKSADSCLKACMMLETRIKAKYFVLKLGERGAFLYDGTYYKFISPYEVEAVDTTAAGDAFTAALTVEYMKSGDIRRACEYANIIGAITVSRAGAYTSIPTLDEVRDFIYKSDIKFQLK